MSQVALKPKEFLLLRDLIHANTGIVLDDRKADLVRGRLGKRLRHHKLSSFRDYYELVKADKSGGELTALIDAISTNKTDFFRENAHFEFLEDELLPSLIAVKKQRGERKIRIWCAACSTGEEAYTLTIVLARMKLIESTAWDTRILATDISDEVLRHASRGEYKPDRISPIPSVELRAYFDRTAEGTYQIKNQLRRLITFGNVNLLKEKYPFQGPFDFVFCRNVMIYFDSGTRESIANRIYRYLTPGGYFFIAHSESLSNVRHSYQYVKPAIYRKGESWHK